MYYYYYFENEKIDSFPREFTFATLYLYCSFRYTYILSERISKLFSVKNLGWDLGDKSSLHFGFGLMTVTMYVPTQCATSLDRELASRASVDGYV